MRFRRSGPAWPALATSAGKQRFRLTRSRRLAVLTCAVAGLTATVAGLTAVTATAGDAGQGPGNAGAASPGVAATIGSRGAEHAAARHAAARHAAAHRGPGTQHNAGTQHGAGTWHIAAHQASQAGAGKVGHARGRQPAARPKALRTACLSVAHVGDSTSVDLISAAYLPNPAERLGARYADVGVRHVKIDASGGRSIVEELPGQRSAYKVASAWHAGGYRGCWVFALGTNDAANIAAGSTTGMMTRISQMMAVAHGQPVLWVNTKTLLTSGPYANANEQAWDKTLVKALAKYPNLRIFDWSAIAAPGWFLSDGIHYNTPGCAIRARAIADALARAFPSYRHGASRIVR